MVKISVVIPVYNVEKYLEQCLDSVIAQSFEDIEVICVNDGSTDSSLEILKRYADNDSRIKIISQKNKGAGAARNVGIENAAGEYVYFMDSDDYLNADAFERLNDFLDDKPDFVMFKIFFKTHVIIRILVCKRNDKKSYSILLLIIFHKFNLMLMNIC